MIGLFIIYFAVIVLLIASMWGVFAKAGKPGWAALIPIYNLIVLLEIVGKPWWWLLLMMIPLLNIVFAVWTYNLLSKSFGKSEGFTVGLLLLSIIFLPILAFGEAKYQGPAGSNEVANTPTFNKAAPNSQNFNKQASNTPNFNKMGSDNLSLTSEGLNKPTKSKEALNKPTKSKEGVNKPTKNKESSKTPTLNNEGSDTLILKKEGSDSLTFNNAGSLKSKKKCFRFMKHFFF
ncbi:MAG: DUF5684 domain-containing protein [Algoriphagus sp.]|nr:DUF5684 domain-containing protein [Algoriphagus sp.]